MEITASSTRQTEKLAKQVAEKLKPGDILCLYGDLGSGKTTFTGFLVKALGIYARVQSPTFVIARKYKKTNRNGDDSSSGSDAGKNTKHSLNKTQNAEKNTKKDPAQKNNITTVNHLDLYRISTNEEADELGILDYFDEQNSICIIEWPETAEHLLPKKCTKIYFEYAGENKRKITIQNLY